jgi:hypothetical protein
VPRNIHGRYGNNYFILEKITPKQNKNSEKKRKLKP